MNSGERIFNFQYIDKATVQTLFSVFTKDISVAGFTRINSGMSTSNYIVELAGQAKKYVLRIYPADHDHCTTETAAYRYAAVRVSVPEIYFVDPTKDIIPNSYLIMEYIEGVTLVNFISSQKAFPSDLAREISSGLAKLHYVEYPNMALLNENMCIRKNLDPLETQYYSLLEDYAGKHIRANTRERLLAFLQANPVLLKTVSLKHVFSHGDFNFSNIIITPSLHPYFIDLEYCFSAPIYYDIGKFFRSKKPDVQKHITASVKSAFRDGYDDHSSFALPHDWFALAKFADISAMLHLINKPVIPDGWGKDIEDEITGTLALLAAY